jgi:hypothetical protein
MTEQTYPDRPPTLIEFRALLERVTAERGADYVYPESERIDGACAYVFGDGTPGCIIGAALAAYGVPTSRLAEQEGNGAADVMRSLWTSAPSQTWDVDDYARVRDLAITVQSRQDGDSIPCTLGCGAMSWGEAINVPLPD